MAWNPWRALREMAHVDFYREPLRPPMTGMLAHDGRCAVVSVDIELGRRERNETLAHELVHLERGGGSRHPDPVVRAREERWVDEEVARRLIPADELATWLAARGDDPTTVADVAEHWDVTYGCAGRALAMLRHPARRKVA